MHATEPTLRCLPMMQAWPQQLDSVSQRLQLPAQKSPLKPRLQVPEMLFYSFKPPLSREHWHTLAVWTINLRDIRA